MRKNLDTKKLTMTSIFLALVIVLHTISFVFQVGIFQFQLALIPIVIGSILLGAQTGAILGLASALFILISGGASIFWPWNPFATVIIVIVKGVCSGLVPGLIYNALNKNNISTILGSISSPIVNTGLFAIGCMIFFLPNIREEYAAGVEYIFVGFIGVNFFIEFAIISILSPVIIRIIKLSNYNKE